jgi:hypothetical protein
MGESKTLSKKRKSVEKKIMELRPLFSWYKNKIEAEKHGISQSLFNPSQQDEERKIKELKCKQFQAMLDDLQDDQKELIELKYLGNHSRNDYFVMDTLGLDRKHYYAKKYAALDHLAVNFDID